ncbi:uncharacterized protein LOC134854684 [Symsagittifera roscoffensis]|uniref:uncharacterized protein LOC134854684 n=1 Tax=Symsagittifera roscoffensis TaxID=84072 RepID=UPI00307C88DC
MVSRIAFLFFGLIVTWVNCTEKGKQPMVFNDNLSPTWSSLVFYLPNDIFPIGISCAKFSNFYCLSGYHTGNVDEEISQTAISREVNVGNSRVAVLASQFETLINMHWKLINMFDIFEDSKADQLVAEVREDPQNLSSRHQVLRP